MPRSSTYANWRDSLRCASRERRFETLSPRRSWSATWCWSPSSCSSSPSCSSSASCGGRCSRRPSRSRPSPSLPRRPTRPPRGRRGRRGRCTSAAARWTWRRVGSGGRRGRRPDSCRRTTSCSTQVSLTLTRLLPAGRRRAAGRSAV